MRPLIRTAYMIDDPALLDPSHPDRIDMAEQRIDRLVLTVLGPLGDWA